MSGRHGPLRTTGDLICTGIAIVLLVVILAAAAVSVGRGHYGDAALFVILGVYAFHLAVFQPRRGGHE